MSRERSNIIRRFKREAQGILSDGEFWMGLVVWISIGLIVGTLLHGCMNFVR